MTIRARTTPTGTAVAGIQNGKGTRSGVGTSVKARLKALRMPKLYSFGYYIVLYY